MSTTPSPSGGAGPESSEPAPELRTLAILREFDRQVLDRYNLHADRMDRAADRILRVYQTTIRTIGVLLSVAGLLVVVLGAIGVRSLYKRVDEMVRVEVTRSMLSEKNVQRVLGDATAELTREAQRFQSTATEHINQTIAKIKPAIDQRIRTVETEARHAADKAAAAAIEGALSAAYEKRLSELDAVLAQARRSTGQLADFSTQLRVFGQRIDRLDTR